MYLYPTVSPPFHRVTPSPLPSLPPRHSLYFVTLWPIAAAFLLLIVAPLVTCCMRRGISYGQAVSAYVTPVLTLTFLVFISTSTKCLSYFKCDLIVSTVYKHCEYRYAN